MLSRPNRLHRERDVRRVLRAGARAQGPAITMRMSKSPNAPTRVAVVVSQRVEKSSVKRNLLKRRIRAVVRKMLPQLTAGYDVALIARPGNHSHHTKDIEKEIRQLFQGANILHVK